MNDRDLDLTVKKTFHRLALQLARRKRTTFAVRTMADSDPPDDPRIPERKLGATFRRLRRGQGMSLKTLSEKSGVSISMISQIERDRANPSMRVLTAIRRALNIPMQDMFSDNPAASGEDPSFLRRAAKRPLINIGSLQKELLTSGGDHSLQIMIITIAPGGSSGKAALSYPAEKGGLVLEGRLTLAVNGQEASLTEGDSFVFDSSLGHGFRNDSEQVARILWVISAVQFDRHL